ncbi:MAG TPA: 50S ribosomal protein L22 [Patescibacteria group bacterium]|nr:50S ribosomal protein L22 [Patescibacteria group bacterium]
MANTASTTSSSKLVKASARQLRIAPRKMRLVTNLVKGMNALDAVAQLRHANKKAAPILAKLIESAVANAKNNFSLDPQHLYIKSVTCDMGQVMKRYFPRARGSASEIRRKMSHVNLVLEERKAAKGSRAKASFLNRTEKTAQPETANVDQQAAAAAKAPRQEGRKSQVFRTEEQIKQSKAQNKRRLFNRKSGE